MGLTSYFGSINYIIPPIRNDWLLGYSWGRCCLRLSVQGGCESVYQNGGAESHGQLAGKPPQHRCITRGSKLRLPYRDWSLSGCLHQWAGQGYLMARALLLCKWGTAAPPCRKLRATARLLLAALGVMADRTGVFTGVDKRARRNTHYPLLPAWQRMTP